VTTRSQSAPRGRPTLETVAALAGVSRATVSRVVNGHARVRPEHRAAVRAAIAATGFVPNRAARSLVTRRHESVALLLREPAEFGVADPYLSGIVIGVSQALIGSGLQLVMLMAAADEDHRRTADYLRGHVDGVVLVSVHDDDPLPAELVRQGVPAVAGGRPGAGLAGVSVVDVDNRGGGRLAAGHLLAAGRRRPATIAGPPDMSAADDRLAGFCEALEAAGRPAPPVARGDFTAASGESAMAGLLARDPELDAVFAANDLMAVGALAALRAAGRSVPGDVAVVGFDDVPPAGHAHPPLTTVRQPVADQARLLVRLLTERLAGAAPAEVVLPTTLVVRASA